MMNRRDFLKSAFSSTFKEILSPLIERDIEMLERVAETVSGLKYYRVPAPKEDSPFEETAVQSEPIIVARRDGRYIALSRKCPSCGQIMNYLAYRQLYKCFSCEREAALADPERFTAYPTKIEEGLLYVGIPPKEDRHA